MGTLKNRQKGHKNALIIGRDFRFSPIGNHKHPIVQKSADKGEVFAREYVKHFNAVWAAEGAGIKTGEIWSSKQGIGAPGVKGVKSSPKSKYKHIIEKELQKMGSVVKDKGITPEQVVDEIASIAFNNDGEFSSNSKLKVTTDHKLKALDMLAKYLGLYEKDNKQKVADTQVLQIAFVGADYAEHQAKAAQSQKAILANSVDKNPELRKRSEDLKARIVGSKTLDLKAYAETKSKPKEDNENTK